MSSHFLDFTSPISTTSGGGGGLDWLSQLLPNLSGSGGSNLQYLIPAMTAAYSQFNNADKYTTQSEKYADQLDPFGKQRGYYQDQLRLLESDPSSIANTPGYQFALKQGLGAVNRADMAKRGIVPNSDDIAYASGLAQQTYNSRIKQLQDAAGAGIGPGSAASMLQTGLKGSIDSRNQALQSMFFPFFASQNRTIPNPNNTIPGMGTTIPGGGGLNPGFGGGGTSNTWSPTGGWGINQGPNWSGEANPDPYYNLGYDIFNQAPPEAYLDPGMDVSPWDTSGVDTSWLNSLFGF